MATSRGGGDDVRERVSKVWSYLDQLAENNPDEYKRFIDKAMKERKEFMEPPRPVFAFSTGIRGKTGQKLYVNVCQWTRVPIKQDHKEDLIPVRGGVLRHLVEESKIQPNCLLVDIAFSPFFIHSCRQEGKMIEAFLELTLDFVDDYLSLSTDRNVDIVEDARFKGPEEDIFHSLDQENGKKVSPESRLDFSETLMTSLKKEKKTKNKKQGSNGLPPLFPQQHGNPGNGCQETHKLIEEVPSSPTQNGKIQNGHQKKKNGGRNGGRKKSNHKRNDDGGKSEETTLNKGRSFGSSQKEEESGWSLGESEAGKKMPENKVTIVGEEGGKDLIIVRVKLPEIESVEEIDLDASESDIKVIAGDVYSFTIRFPIPVNSDLSSASFSKRSHTLSVKLPALDLEC